MMSNITYYLTDQNILKLEKPGKILTSALLNLFQKTLQQILLTILEFSLALFFLWQFQQI